MAEIPGLGSNPQEPIDPCAEHEPAERRVPWWGAQAPVIVVPLDGSVEAKVALSAARQLSPVTDATIAVVYVTDDASMSPESLLKSVGLSAEHTDGLTVESATGDEASAINDLAERRRAMLIAMTTHGLSRPDAPVSPVVESVLDGAPSPVLLVRPELAEQLARATVPRRLLLPLDGTPMAAATLVPALDLAERLDAEVDILNVAGQSEPLQEPGSLSAPFYVDQPQHEWPAWAREFAERFGTALAQRRLPARVQVFVRSGDPVDEIVRFAQERDSDLIVLQWRGRAGEEQRGPVVQELISRMPCPVLLHSATEPA